MPSPTVPSAKSPFNIERALKRVRTAVEPFPKAALFQLALEGFQSVFEQLVACIISIRTYDEVTLPTARRLFEVARTPEALVKLPVPEIDGLIHACTFHTGKAAQLHEIARQIVEQYDGETPCDQDALLAFRGVGPKCAGLALGIACNQPHISVDIHVHRVVNRWGYIRATTPERTMDALREKLPRANWIELNSLLVPFGKHICTGKLPKCSTCPLLDMCPQIGVDKHR